MSVVAPQPPVAERLAFGHTIEAVLKAFAPFSADELERLAGLKLDPHRPLGAAYPLATHIAVLDLLAETRFPSLPQVDAHTEIGRLFIGAYEKTLTGRALMAAMRVLGPRRVLERLNRSFQTGNNFTETRLVALGPHDVEVWFNHVERAGFFKGILLAGLVVAGAKNPSVEIARRQGTETWFRVRWDA